MEIPDSQNKDAMLRFVDRLRKDVEDGTLMQMMIFCERPDGFMASWTCSEELYSICGFVLAATMERMNGRPDRG